MNGNPTHTDVCICGAGPTGLLLAYSLARQGVSSQVIEMYERKEQEKHGRAAGLWPRSLELLEREDLFDELAQIGLFVHKTATYKNGQLVPERGGYALSRAMKDSYHSHMLHIRQKCSEDVFRSNYEALGYKVQFGREVVGYEVDSSIGDGCNVSVRIKHVESGEQNTVRCKYLVGADGGRSKIRHISNIRMEGQRTALKWVRIDGKFKTNMPRPDCTSVLLETETHGIVSWLRLDQDVCRIGYALSPELCEKYGENITEEQAKYEAIQGMKPFTLEIERLDWMTCYGIGQGVAEHFHFNDYVFLAGDAGHTHSSGFAQGMNTGVHDATNLAWKLAGVIKGWYNPSILRTYEHERRPCAQKLIEIDKSAAAALSGEVPPKYVQLAAHSGPEEVFWKLVEENGPFTVGLGIDYPNSTLNKPAQRKLMLRQGARAPDVLLQKPGAHVTKIRLYEINKAPGRWTVIVFAGNTALTVTPFARLRKDLSSETSFAKKYADLVDLMTVVPGIADSPWSVLDGPAIGKMFLDPNFQTHETYGVPLETGAIVVLRPDTFLGFAADLSGVEEVDRYFAGICQARSLL